MLAMYWALWARDQIESRTLRRDPCGQPGSGGADRASLGDPPFGTPLPGRAGRLGGCVAQPDDPITQRIPD